MNSRRKFITKLSGLASVGALSSFGVLANTKEQAKENEVKITTKPLGFQWETKDPFLFCVHHEDYYPAGNEKFGPKASLAGRQLGQDFLIKDGWRMYHGKEVPGFPGHPHRGFETITIVLKGMVDHSDSMGGAGRYGDGDVQWLTSGKGVQHAEMFPLINKDKENTMELFQIWINLPKANKFVEPHFKMLWNDTIPQVKLKDKNSKEINISVIAGEIDNQSAPTPPPNSWAAAKENNVAIYNATLDAGATWDLPTIEEGTNSRIYFYEGDSIDINGETAEKYHSIDVNGINNLTLTAGNTACKVLVLQGKPIDEPVVQHGPFVMNTREEIKQAFHDYQTTQFGGWPWESSSPVHKDAESRFAKHADGTIEKRG